MHVRRHSAVPEGTLGPMFLMFVSFAVLLLLLVASIA
jgi:hypothetical protein